MMPSCSEVLVAIDPSALERQSTPEAYSNSTAWLRWYHDHSHDFLQSDQEFPSLAQSDFEAVQRCTSLAPDNPFGSSAEGTLDSSEMILFDAPSEDTQVSLDDTRNWPPLNPDDLLDTDLIQWYPDDIDHLELIPEPIDTDQSFHHHPEAQWAREELQFDRPDYASAPSSELVRLRLVDDHNDHDEEYSLDTSQRGLTPGSELVRANVGECRTSRSMSIPSIIDLTQDDDTPPKASVLLFNEQHALGTPRQEASPEFNSDMASLAECRTNRSPSILSVIDLTQDEGTEATLPNNTTLIRDTPTNFIDLTMDDDNSTAPSSDAMSPSTVFSSTPSSPSSLPSKALSDSIGTLDPILVIDDKHAFLFPRARIVAISDEIKNENLTQSNWWEWIEQHGDHFVSIANSEASNSRFRVHV